jgi:aldose 1-epimerase
MRSMKKLALLIAIVILALSSVSALLKETQPIFAAKQISVDGISIVRLTDANAGIEVSIVPSLNNMAYEMKVHGKNILFFPEMTLSNFQKAPRQAGIPFLAPWANRIDGTGFWANGKKYEFDMTPGNIRKDQNALPIHGLLTDSTPWQVTDVGADGESAHVTSKLEFWKYPNLMAQWPFAHEYEMTYRLANGGLEVRTTILNRSAEAMPLAIGFHPYYRIPDVPRDQWTLRMPDCKSVIVDKRLIPTGEFKSSDLPNPLPLKGRTLDDGFTNFERDHKGRAAFSIESGDKRIELWFGQNYPVAVIWEPAFSMDFICIEPMTGVTNGINLNHSGKYPALQTVPANGKWTESFWIRAAGL